MSIDYGWWLKVTSVGNNVAAIDGKKCWLHQVAKVANDAMEPMLLIILIMLV